MNSAGSIRQQQGAVLVLTVLCLFVLMGAAGLAIDISRTLVNKTIEQNAADAAALSAAIRLNKNNKPTTNVDEIAAEAAGKATYNLFKIAPGNGEIQGKLADSDFNFSFTQSSDLSASPIWTSATDTLDANFVRVTTNNMAVNTWFAAIGFPGIPGFSTLNVSSSAVAGFTPIAPCDLAPVLMCADVDSDGKPKDTTCADGSCYGYTQNTLYCMTDDVSNSENHANNPFICEITPYGPGSIGLLNFAEMFPDLPQGGGALAQKCLAGDTACKNLCEAQTESECESETCTDNCACVKSGTTWSAVRDGLGSLFNQQNGTATYPSDTVTGYGTLAGASTAPTLVTPTEITAYLTDHGMTIPITQGQSIINKPQMPKSGIALDQFIEDGKNPYAHYSYFTDQNGKDTHATSDAMDRKRILGIPFVDCRGFTGPTATLPIVGYGCFWMSAPPEKYDSATLVLGAFVGDKVCNATGKTVSDKDYGFDKVILYKDPSGAHS
jgi:Flp pilus assembly protein TadG